MAPVSVYGARQAAQIAGRFRDLQGLRQAVAGVGLLLLFGWEMAFPLTPADIRAAGIAIPVWGAALLLVGLALLIVTVRWVSAWYGRRYGLVELTRRQKVLGAVVGACGLLAFLIPFEIDVLAMNDGHTLTVNLIVFAMALWIIGYWLYLGRPFWHYLVIAGIGFGLGIASIAGIPPATFAWHLREATLYFAIASIAGGVIDHMILTRSLSRSERSVGLES
jgi:MFS family permease